MVHTPGTARTAEGDPLLLEVEPRNMVTTPTGRDCPLCGATSSGVRIELDVVVVETGGVIDHMTTEGCGACGHCIPTPA